MVKGKKGSKKKEVAADATEGHKKRDLGKIVGLDFVHPSNAKNAMTDEVRKCAVSNPAVRQALHDRETAEANTKGKKKDREAKIDLAANMYEAALDTATPNLGQASRYATAAYLEYVIGGAVTAVLEKAQADNSRMVKAEHILSADYPGTCPVVANLVTNSASFAQLVAKVAADAEAKASGDSAVAGSSDGANSSGASSSGSTYFRSVLNKLKDKLTEGASDPLPEVEEMSDFSFVDYVSQCRIRAIVKDFFFGSGDDGFEGLAAELSRNLVKAAYVRMLKDPEDDSGKFKNKTLDTRQVFGAVMGFLALSGLEEAGAGLISKMKTITEAARAVALGDKIVSDAKAAVKEHGGGAGAAVDAECAETTAKADSLVSEAEEIFAGLAGLNGSEFSKAYKQLGEAKDRAKKVAEHADYLSKVSAAIDEL